ncbi:hypothetical protein M2137_002703 [Parabacteroides sp. PFB2-10]|uniref:hypothetical protein n=1 Tax=Parabacteroides sp. PFB2-10 TaxID=1742405 RepID=UPI002476F9DD|nr:hypothetical protein [Parabacteroides sp. PFB2-10]MDH6313912.1 hypothetical protein [Parabacteroides sp. PFB2-10]
MGLSIHYSGRIKDAASLPLLIEEVKDVCSVYGWKYRIAETVFPNNTLNEQEHFSPIYGISFTPPECETISLTFLSNGVMACSSGIYLFGNSKNATERDYIYRLFAKTQFAGMATHAIIINLFRHLESKYLTDFKLKDDSRYWETGDENLLQEKFKEYDALLDNFVLSFQTFPVEKGEGLMDYFDRLLEHINRLKK